MSKDESNNNRAFLVIGIGIATMVAMLFIAKLISFCYRVSQRNRQIQSQNNLTNQHINSRLSFINERALNIVINHKEEESESESKSEIEEESLKNNSVKRNFVKHDNQENDSQNNSTPKSDNVESNMVESSKDKLLMTCDLLFNSINIEEIDEIETAGVDIDLPNTKNEKLNKSDIENNEKINKPNPCPNITNFQRFCQENDLHRAASN